eukprot:scaffold2296_cov88-Phaeocystis_antarctica.AAC.1
MGSYCVTGEGTHRDHESLRSACSPKFGTGHSREKKVGRNAFAPGRASHSACCTQWPPCFLGKGEHRRACGFCFDGSA